MDWASRNRRSPWLARSRSTNAPGGIYTDAAGDTFMVNYLVVDPANGDLLPNDVDLTILSAVPEPST